MNATRSKKRERDKAMCLDKLYDRSGIKKLLTEFGAYKVVIEKDGAYYFPVFDTQIPIRPNNVAKEISFFEHPLAGGKYKPYYHSFKTRRACDEVEKAFPGRYKFIEIKIKKQHVTRLGIYGQLGGPRYKTIISREFTTDFVEYIPHKGKG